MGYLLLLMIARSSAFLDIASSIMISAPLDNKSLIILACPFSAALTDVKQKWSKTTDFVSLNLSVS